jgi:hypothetical protein
MYLIHTVLELVLTPHIAATGSPKTLVTAYVTTQCHSTEYNELNISVIPVPLCTYKITVSIHSEQHKNVFVLLYYFKTCFGHWPSSGTYIRPPKSKRRTDIEMEVSTSASIRASLWFSSMSTWWWAMAETCREIIKKHGNVVVLFWIYWDSNEIFVCSPWHQRYIFVAVDCPFASL